MWHNNEKYRTYSQIINVYILFPCVNRIKRSHLSPLTYFMHTSWFFLREFFLWRNWEMWFRWRFWVSIGKLMPTDLRHNVFSHRWLVWNLIQSAWERGLLLSAVLTSPARRRGQRSGLEGRAAPGAQDRVGQSDVLPTDLNPYNTSGHLQGGACLMSKTLIKLFCFNGI